MKIWYLLIATALPAFIISLFTGYLMRRIAPRIGFVDSPGGRKSHDRPMPLGGGVAIMAGVVLVLLAGFLVAYLQFKGVFSLHLAPEWIEVHFKGITRRGPQMLGILLGATALHVVGILDDVYDVSPWIKLICQFTVAAFVVVVLNVKLTFFIQWDILAYAITILWIVTITNAFNFLDNADGLSAGMALICAVVCLVVAASGKQIFVPVMWAVIAGSLAGFLVHNFPPARIFMGDAGSLPVGFLLAVGSILTTYYYQKDAQNQPVAAITPLIIMAIPLYDFLSVLHMRYTQGRRLWVGDKSHFSHRLLERGFSPRSMVLTIYLATACTACGAIVLRHVALPCALLIFAQTLCIIAIIALLEYPGQDASANQAQ